MLFINKPWSTKLYQVITINMIIEVQVFINFLLYQYMEQHHPSLHYKVRYDISRFIQAIASFDMLNHFDRLYIFELFYHSILKIDNYAWSSPSHIFLTVILFYI